jgi:hypothetical protein
MGTILYSNSQMREQYIQQVNSITAPNAGKVADAKKELYLLVTNQGTLL